MIGGVAREYETARREREIGWGERKKPGRDREREREVRWPLCLRGEHNGPFTAGIIRQDSCRNDTLKWQPIELQRGRGYMGKVGMISRSKIDPKVVY